jgi:hypothetical protein
VALAAISLPTLEEFVITGKLNLLKLQQILNREAKVILIKKYWLLIRGQLFEVEAVNIRLLSLNSGKMY